jgi:hypothetical protein
MLIPQLPMPIPTGRPRRLVTASPQLLVVGPGLDDDPDDPDRVDPVPVVEGPVVEVAVEPVAGWLGVPDGLPLGLPVAVPGETLIGVAPGWAAVVLLGVVAVGDVA